MDGWQTRRFRHNEKRRVMDEMRRAYSPKGIIPPGIPFCTNVKRDRHRGGNFHSNMGRKHGEENFHSGRSLSKMIFGPKNLKAEQQKHTMVGGRMKTHALSHQLKVRYENLYSTRRGWSAHQPMII
jgi:hypothetical protein